MRVLFAFPAPKGTDSNAYTYHGDFVSASNLIKSLKTIPTQDFTIEGVGPEGLTDITYEVPKGSKHQQKKVFEHLEKIQDKYDLIHYHIGGWNAINYFKRIRKPLVLTIHDPPTSGLEFSFYSKVPFIKALDEQNITVVYPTEYSKDAFLNRLDYAPAGNKTEFIHHGIPIKTEEEVLSLLRNNLCSEQFLSVGRLDLLKNFHLASELLGPDLTVIGGFNIHGKKPVSLWLEHFAKYGTKHKMPISKEELYTEYTNYTSYISLSKVETFGFTAVEAAMVGTPIIVPNEGGLKEIAHIIGGGILQTPFRRKKQLKDEIIAFNEVHKLWTSHDRLISYRKAKLLFPIEREASSYYNLYKKVLGK